MVAPARAAAFRALGAIGTTAADLGDALSAARDPLPDVRDRALATELVTGTLRWRGAIDYQLQLRSARPLSRLDAAVLDVLRLGAYQLLHLRRVPDAAVVNDAVAMVKKAGFTSAGGFANAILRRLAREREHLTWPEPPDTDATPGDRERLVHHLSTVHSHPAWLVQRWIARYGVDVAARWLPFNNQPPAMTVAANRLRGSRGNLAAQLAAEGIGTIPTPHAPHGLMVTGGRVLASQAFRTGACVVQDEASQMIPELVLAAPGHRVLDACAAPGGKTIALAAQVGVSGLVAATDVRARRVALLAETIARCGAGRVHIAQVGTTGPLPFADGSFDRILVDAPCSGLGTIRRDPDIRWRRSPDDLPRLEASQRLLLDRIAPLVAAGGRVIYSTCSSEPEENEGVVEAFLAGHRDFAVAAVQDLDRLAPSVRAFAASDGYLRTDPTRGLEAFFGAVLQRT